MIVDFASYRAQRKLFHSYIELIFNEIRIEMKK